MDGLPAILGVTQSVSGKRWVQRCDDGRAVSEIARVAQVPDILARVLAGRGVRPDQALAFLRPSLRQDLPDPDCLTDMARAAARIARAVEGGETIAIFGDYDVDGATSSALLARFLKTAGAKALIYIPDRMKEGYGPNAAALTKLANDGARLIITVDCGTQAHAALEAGGEAGADIIVCDHHLPSDTLPRAFAIINPNRREDTSGLGQLCAAGVAFLLAVAVNRALRQAGWYSASRPEPDLMALVPLVALGTVADVVPLTGPNRALVLSGLKVMRERPVAGLQALMAVAGLQGAVTPYHLGFILGPRVNAGGRVGDCGLGAELLSTDDPGRASALALQLDQFNKERQAIEALILEDALSMAQALDQAGRQVLVIAKEGWHAGVVGIVASRVKERFGKPAVVIGLEGGYGKGSARSVSGADIGSAMTRAREAGLLLAGGGHAMAAGLTVRPDMVEALADFLEQDLGAAAADSQDTLQLEVDGALSGEGLSPSLAVSLAAAGPFGSGNPEPVFVIPDQALTFVKPVGDGHVRFTARGIGEGRLGGIAFRAAGGPVGQALLEARGRHVHLAGSLQVSEWQGEARTELRLIDLAFVA